MEKVLHELKERLTEQLKKVVRKEDITEKELENSYKMVDILKDIATIEAMDDYGDEFEEGESMRYGKRYSRMMPYDGTYPYYRANRPGRESYNRYGSRSDGKEAMIKRLEEMMADAPSEKERMAISQCIDKLYE